MRPVRRGLISHSGRGRARSFQRKVDCVSAIAYSQSTVHSLWVLLMSDAQNEAVAIENRRVAVAERYIEGWSQRAIAQEVGVSQRTVCEDLKAIRAEWAEARIAEIDSHVERQTRALAKVQREAWAAWERSIGVVKRTTSRVRDADGEKLHEVVTVEDIQNGDARYLQLVLDATEKTAKLLGTFAPERHEVYHYSADDVAAEAAKMGLPASRLMELIEASTN